MRLEDVLTGIPAALAGTDRSLDITGLAYDSRKVRPGFLFAALKGGNRNGLDFIGGAEANGAAAVMSSWPKPPTGRLPWVQVPDAREALAVAAANFYGHPADRLKMVGVTGTKGKTTFTYILEQILKSAGQTPGVLGTVEYRWPGQSSKAVRTTPEAPDLQAMLRSMLDAGATHCLIEVSSHALDQKRVWGMGFDVAVFTNLSGEHLDYHRTMERYFEAKRKLFYMNHKRQASVVNADDPWGKKLIAELSMKTVTFGLEPEAIVRAVRYDLTDRGMDIRIAYPGGVLPVCSRLVGRHNVSNILAAAAAALALGVAPADIAAGVAALAGVPGRFELVENPLGLRVIVDYAHTDDALAHLLTTVREFKPRRVILVFGAGGNRDTAKRERMGRVAARLADWSILTSDNPRDEDPMAIIAAIAGGFEKESARTYDIVPDRREAIARALASAGSEDYVLIAGKGHEDYQVFRDRTVHFSDVEAVREILAGAGKD